MLPAAIGIGAGLLSALPSIFGGISANKQYKKHAQLLEGMKLDMPGELDVVSEILRQRMGKDMPGYEQAQSDIMNTIPTTMNQVKNAAGSSADILGAIGDIQHGAATNINSLAVQNALSKMQSEGNYTNFLSSVKAPMQMQIQQYANQAKIAGSEARMQGKAQLWQGLAGGLQQGVQGGMGAYTGLMGLQQQGDMLENLKKYWGQTPGGGSDSGQAMSNLFGMGNNLPGMTSAAMGSGFTAPNYMKSSFGENWLPSLSTWGMSGNSFGGAQASPFQLYKGFKF